MADRIQIRRDLAANWTSANPILAQGEEGFEIDVNPFKLKIGDGTTPWNSLPYFTGAVTPSSVVISAGTQAFTGSNFTFQNANGLTFGMDNGTLSASYNSTQFLGTAVTSNFRFTSQNSQLRFTSQDTQLQFTSANSNFRFTSQDSQLRFTSADTQLQFTSANSNFRFTSQDSQLRFTSQDSQLQFTSANSNFLGTGATSDFRFTSADSQLQFTSQMSDYQLVANSSLSLGTGATTSFRFTSQDTQLRFTSADSQLRFTSADSQLRFTSADSQLQFTSANSNFRFTSADTQLRFTSADTQLRFTSADTQLQFTSNTSAITSNALNTSVSRVINIVANTNSTAGGTASLSSNVSFSAANGITFYTSAGGAIVANYGSANLQYTSNTSAITSNAMNTSVSSRFAGINSAITNGSMTVNTSGISINLPAYLTTARASTDAVGLNTALTANGVAWTVNSSGISLNIPAFLTTAMLSNAATISNINVSGGTTSSNLSNFKLIDSNGISWSLDTGSKIYGTVKTDYQTSGAYLTTAMQSNAATISNINISGGTTSSNLSNFKLIDSNGVSWSVDTGSKVYATVKTDYQTSGAYLTTAMVSNAGSNFVNTNAGLNLTNISATFNSNSISLSVAAAGSINISGGTTSSNLTNFKLIDSNGVSWSLDTGSKVYATVKTDYQTSGAYLTTAMLSNAATISNIDISGGTTSSNLSNFKLIDSNGISWSLDTGSKLYATVKTDYQTSGAYLTTAMASNAGSLFVNTNAGLNLTNISATFNSNSISLSVAAPGAANINISGGTTSSNLAAFKLIDSNGISWSLDTGSKIYGTVATNYQSQGAYLTTADLSANSSNYFRNWKLTGNTAGTTSSAQGTDLWLAGGNGLTISGSGNTLSFSVATNYQSQGAYLTTARASNDAIGLNSAQSNATWTLNSSGLSFDGRGYAGIGTSATNASITLNSNGLAISVAAGGGGGATVNGSTGNVSLTVASSLSFSSNGSTISFGLASNITTALQSAGAYLTTAMQSNAATISNINLSAGTTSGNLSAFVLSNSNNATWGLNGSTVTISSPISISAGTTNNNFTNIVFSNSNAVSFGLNGSTMTASVAGNITYSGYNPFDMAVLTAATIGISTLFMQPFNLPNVQFDRAVFPILISNATNSSGSFTLSQLFGIYTRNASTLSLLTSASISTNFSGSGTAGSYSLYGGIRNVTVGLTTTLSAGAYYFANIFQFATAGSNVSISQYILNNIQSNLSGLLGAANVASAQWILGQGVYSAATGALPSAIPISQIQGFNNNASRPPVMNLASGTI